MPDFGIFRGFNDKLFGNKLYAGQLPMQLGTIGSIVIPIALLDLYPNAAAAYSLRQLRAAYTGSAIRVRRSSDNTEQNIGFTALGGLDTSALTSFCVSGNGFVTTWYDQSGNARNATQTTAANQPQIVSSGSVITEGGKPTIDHIGSTDLKLSSNFTIGNIYSMYGVVKFDSYNKELFGALTGSYGIYQDANTNYHNGGGVGFSNGVFGLNFALLSIYRNGTVSVSQYKNSSILGSAFNLSANGNFVLKSLSGEEISTYNLDGKLSEAIIYTTHQFSNQSGLEGNIKTYYGL
jgi:hypothetical protein